MLGLGEIATLTVGSGVAALIVWHDVRTRRLPNRVIVLLAAVAVLGFAASALIDGDRIPWSAMALGSLYFCGPWLVVYLLSAQGIGAGDVKLAASLGLFIGWADPWSVSVALLASSVVFGVGMVIDRSDLEASRPFAPALVAGAGIGVVVALVA